jgi:hypothetical protein
MLSSQQFERGQRFGNGTPTVAARRASDSSLSLAACAPVCLAAVPCTLRTAQRPASTGGPNWARLLARPQSGPDLASAPSPLHLSCDQKRRECVAERVLALFLVPVGPVRHHECV